jgi:hypothetical protein
MGVQQPRFEFWRLKSARWENVTVPLYSVGNWTGMGLHLRGNVEGYVNAASKHKKLRIHSGTHFHPFHSEEGRLDQLRFMDYWLKGRDTGIMDEPPVKLMIRTGGDKTTKSYRFRFENEWPIARHGCGPGGHSRWNRRTECGGEGRRARRRAAAGNHEVHYAASPPSHAGVSSSAPSHAAGSVDRTGISLIERAARRRHRDHRSRRAGAVGLQHSEDMDDLATIRKHRARRQGRLGKRASRGGTIAGRERLAAGPRIASWIRRSPSPTVPTMLIPTDSGSRPRTSSSATWSCGRCAVVVQKGTPDTLDIQPPRRVGASAYRHYHADYNIGAQNTVHTGGARVSYLMLPVVPAQGDDEIWVTR